ncbi:ADP-ribosyl cyclase/cyclic ADP-ribose hydrolase 1-like [Epinephelus lanceolatus]
MLSETFTACCLACNGCENNPVRSFWNRVSAAFAEHACGEVTVMLNGSKEQPFDPKSTFARIEIKALKHPEVKHLNLFLVTGHKKMSDCTSQSLQDLQGKLDPNISYTCREVMKSQIEECAPSTNAACGACFSKSIQLSLIPDQTPSTCC